MRGTSVKTLSSSNLSISLRVAARHSFASASSMASLKFSGNLLFDVLRCIVVMDEVHELVLVGDVLSLPLRV